MEEENGLGEEIYELDLDGVLEKAEAELTGYSDDQIRDLLKQLDKILDQWANEHGYHRADRRVGTTVKTEWLPPDDSSPFDLPSSSVAVIVQRLFPEKYSPLEELVERLSPDDRELGLAKVFALLILREVVSGDADSVIEAVEAYDGRYAYIRRLADIGFKTKRGWKRGGRKGAVTRSEKTKLRDETIVSFAKTFLAKGHKPHELTRLITENMDVREKTVRRVLQREKILKKRTRTEHVSI